MLRIIFSFFILLFSLNTSANPPPLPGDKVFQLTGKRVDAHHLKLTWTIKSGYFLYRERIHVDLPKSSRLNLEAFVFPEPQFKIDHRGHTVLLYRDQLALTIPLQTLSPGETPLLVKFQGCSDQGFCYPPTTKTLMLVIDDQLKLRDVFLETPDVAKPVFKSPRHEKIRSAQFLEKTVAEQPSTQIERLFSSGNTLLIIATFFGFGLLLTFTPCILPMVPVISGMIVGHGHAITTRKAIGLSVCYVLSMSTTYSLIGGVIALLGHNLQIYMQSPIAVVGFSFLFILLALSMFGLFELRLPLGLQNRLAKFTRHESGGHYLHAAIMGCLSILILSPCVTPPLLGVLSYIARQGSFSLGLAALFFLGLGMGAPLILVGASAGKLLPKAGKWMNTVKSLFGVLLLAVAIHLLSRLLSDFYTMLLWALLLIFTGVACKPFVAGINAYTKWRQGLGIISLTYGLFILYGASAGHTNPLLPLQTPPALSEQVIKSLRVTTLHDAQRLLQEAKNKHTPAILDFTATWCESCNVLANTTLRDPRVIKATQSIMWIEVDLSENNQNSINLLHSFNVIAPPTFLFYNADGEQIQALTLVGEVSVATMMTQIQQMLKKSSYDNSGP